MCLNWTEYQELEILKFSFRNPPQRCIYSPVCSPQRELKGKINEIQEKTAGQRAANARTKSSEESWCPLDSKWPSRSLSNVNTAPYRDPLETKLVCYVHVHKNYSQVKTLTRAHDAFRFPPLILQQTDLITAHDVI